ncbi:retrotransposon protein, putative, ty1-copia subclass [Tanacetum coccineum]|uniref:Retrotransposon protein, putative, ty1-copia subclass n=1 Tax=Tanacetum coccineum TaxID=301880 RepID=A0ABQ5GBQ7_9ASTR
MMKIYTITPPKTCIIKALSVSKDNLFYFNAIHRDGIFEIDMHNHVSIERSIYTCSNKKSKRNLDSTFIWHCRLSHINKKRITKLKHNGILKLIDDELFDVCVSCISGKMARKPFTHAGERANELRRLIHTNNSLISQEASGSTVDFDEIQRQDAQPSENTSEHHLKADHEDIEPQTALSDPEPDKWLEAMNAKMQSIKDNQVWNLVNLPPNYNTVGSKWLFKKKTDIKVIRILMAILAFYDYEIWQMDVKTAFLNGHLYEDVYMVKPERFVNPKHPRRNILKYLQNTKDMFLVYGGDSATELSLTCYTNAGWETDRDDHRSQTGYVFAMNRGAVDWNSSKQSTTAMSSTYAEYIAASEAAMEAIWIRNFIYGLDVILSNDRPMDMYCDTTSAITIADEPEV